MHPTAVEDGLPQPRRAWSMVAIWAALSLAVLDGAIANVSLPTIARDLAITPAASIWVVNAYQLAITVCLLPFSALGDRVGYRRLYLAGLGVFTLGSLGCALSHTLSGLVLARVLQGLGAAGIMSMNPALVRFTYPSGMLGRAIGWNAVVIAAASAAGPSIAAAILAVADWPWLFAVNLPVGLVAISIGARALPDSPRSAEPFDAMSAVASGGAVGALVFGAELAARDGSAVGYGLVVAGVGLGAALVRREWDAPAPLVPVDLMRIPLFALSILTSMVSFAAQMLAFVALPFWLQHALGRDTVQTGLLVTPWPLGVGLAAPISGRLADRRVPAAVLGAVGLSVFACGLAALALAPTDATDLDLVWRTGLCGVGFGIFQAPNNRTILSSAPRARAGAAGGMLATARLLGQTSGAVGTAVVFHLAGTGGAPTALGCAAAVALVGAAISLSRLAIPPERSDPRAAT